MKKDIEKVLIVYVTVFPIKEEIDCTPKHYCTFCGASADVDGSFCYKGIYACPKHARQAEIQIDGLYKGEENDG